MADLIGALIQARFHAPPRLEPRLPALFEPESPGTFAEPLIEAEETNESAPRGSRQARAPARHALHPSQEPATEREPYRGLQNVPAPPRPPAAQPEAHMPVFEERPQPVDAPRRDPALPVERDRSRDGASEPRAPANDGRAWQDAPVARRAARPIAEPERGALLPPESDADARAEPDESGRPPLIRVNIGRIIVRAVQAAPERPAARPKPARKLSLEEYLKSRERGDA